MPTPHNAQLDLAKSVIDEAITELQFQGRVHDRHIAAVLMARAVEITGKEIGIVKTVRWHLAAADRLLTAMKD